VDWILVVPDGEHCAEPLHFIKKMGKLLNTEWFLISFEGFCFMELVYWNLSHIERSCVCIMRVHHSSLCTGWL